MRIRDLPDSSKPRERFLRHGVEALSDAELFAIILRTGTINENVTDMANRMLKEYPLENLFSSSLAELQKIKGIGPSKAMQILTISELAKRHAQAKHPIKKITQAKDVFDLFHDRLKDKKQEEFWVLMLNSQNNIIKEQLISKGILDSAIIHPREVFKDAIKNSSSKIIILHNHPSGNPEPSQEDIEITKRITKTGDLVNIKVIDHIVLGNPSYFSFKESRFPFLN